MAEKLVEIKSRLMMVGSCSRGPHLVGCRIITAGKAKVEKSGLEFLEDKKVEEIRSCSTCPYVTDHNECSYLVHLSNLSQFKQNHGRKYDAEGDFHTTLVTVI